MERPGEYARVRLSLQEADPQKPESDIDPPAIVLASLPAAAKRPTGYRLVTPAQAIQEYASRGLVCARTDPMPGRTRATPFDGSFGMTPREDDEEDETKKAVNAEPCKFEGRPKVPNAPDSPRRQRTRLGSRRSTAETENVRGTRRS